MEKVSGQIKRLNGKKINGTNNNACGYFFF